MNAFDGSFLIYNQINLEMHEVYSSLKN